MVVRLKEAYENHIPDWVKRALGGRYSYLKKTLLNKNIDLSKMEINEDFDSSYLTDPNKICIFTVQGDYGESGINVTRGGNFLSSEHITLNRRYVDVSKKSMKWIKDNIVKFCWIDAIDASGKNDVHATNREAIKDYPRKSKGQHQYSNGEWSQGDTVRGVGRIDKSGYIVDPDKYVRMLTAVDETNYAQQIERFYKKLRDAIDYCRKIEDDVIYNLQPEEYERKSYASDLRDSIGNVVRYKDYMLQAYNSILRTIEKRVSGNSWDKENSPYTYNTIKKYVQDFNEDYKYFKAEKANFEKRIAMNKEALAEFDAWDANGRPEGEDTPYRVYY